MEDFEAKLRATRLDVMVEVLIRLDTEARQPDMSPYESARRVMGIFKMLKHVEAVYGEEMGMCLCTYTSGKLGHLLGVMGSFSF